MADMSGARRRCLGAAIAAWTLVLQQAAFLCQAQQQENALLQRSMHRRLDAAVDRGGETPLRQLRLLEAQAAASTPWHGARGPIRSALNASRCLGVASFQGTYFLAQAGQDCPAGSRRVLEEAGCVRGSAALGKMYAGSASFSLFSKGCVFGGAQYVYLNTADKDNQTALYSALCQKTELSGVILEFQECDSGVLGPTEFVAYEADSTIRWAVDESHCMSAVGNDLQLLPCVGGGANATFEMPVDGRGRVSLKGQGRCVAAPSMSSAAQLQTCAAASVEQLLQLPWPSALEAAALQPAAMLGLTGHYGALTDFAASPGEIGRRVRRMSEGFGIREFQFYGALEGSLPPEPQAEPDFAVVFSGTCSGAGMAPITEKGVCEEAAAALGLPDRVASTTASSPRPEGCYWFKSSTLWLATSAENVGNGAETSTDTDDREPVCKKVVSTLFRTISQGTCADTGMVPIMGKEECEVAARELGLADIIADTTALKPRPEGCYWFSSASALWLSTSAANAGVGADADGNRQPICKPAPSYKQVSGSCADQSLAPITEVAACEAAAAALGLPDTTASVTTSTPRPEGCYWFASASALWLSDNAANLGIGSAADGNRQQICGSKAASPPAALMQMKVQGKQYMLRSAYGQCLDVDMLGDIGSSVHLKPCLGGVATQVWSQRVADAFEIGGGGCLQINHNQDWKAYVWSCAAVTQPKHLRFDAGTSQLKTEAGRCLDHNPSSATGEVHIGNCDTNNKNQRWSLVDVSTLAHTTTSPPVRLVHNLGACLDVDSPGTASSEAHLVACADSDLGQQWDYDAAQHLFRTRAGQCLTVQPFADWKVMVSMCDVQDARMNFVYDSATLLLKSVSTGKCLDNDPARAGGPVFLGTCNAGNRFQHWTLTENTAWDDAQVILPAPTISPTMSIEVDFVMAVSGKCMRRAQPVAPGSEVSLADCPLQNASAESELEYIWRWNTASEHITDRAAESCLQVVAAKDWLVEMQPCDAFELRQKWRYNADILQVVSDYQGKCIDHDSSKNTLFLAPITSCTGANKQQWMALGESVRFTPQTTTTTTMLDIGFWRSGVNDGRLVRRGALHAGVREAAAVGGRSWLQVHVADVDRSDVELLDGFGTISVDHADFISPSPAWAMRFVPRWALFAKSLGFSGIHWDLPKVDTLQQIWASGALDLAGFVRAALPIVQAQELGQTMNFVEGFGWDPRLSRSVGLGWAGSAVAFPYFETTPAGLERLEKEGISRGAATMTPVGAAAQEGEAPLDAGIRLWSRAVASGGTFVFVVDGENYALERKLAKSVPLSAGESSRASTEAHLVPKTEGLVAAPLLGQYAVLSRWSADYLGEQDVPKLVEMIGAREFQLYGAWEGYFPPPASEMAEWTCATTAATVKRLALRKAVAAIAKQKGRSWLFVNAMSVNHGSAPAGFNVLRTMSEKQATADVVALSAEWAAHIAPAWAAFASEVGAGGIHWDVPDTIAEDMAGNRTGVTDFLSVARAELTKFGLLQTMNFVDGFGFDAALVAGIGESSVGAVVAFPYWTCINKSPSELLAEQAIGGFVLVSYPGMSSGHENEPWNAEHVGKYPNSLVGERWQEALAHGGVLLAFRDGRALLRTREDYWSDSFGWLVEEDMQTLQDTVSLPPALPFGSERQPPAAAGKSPMFALALDKAMSGHFRLVPRAGDGVASEHCAARAADGVGVEMRAACGGSALQFQAMAVEIEGQLASVDRAAGGCLEGFSDGRVEFGRCGGPAGLKTQAFGYRQGYVMWGANSSLCMDASSTLQSGNSVYLLAHTGTHVEVQSIGALARWTDLGGDWQRFTLLRKGGNGLVRHGDVVFLRAHTGLLLEVDVELVQADSDIMGSSQEFILERAAGAGIVKPEDAVYLKAHTQKYVEVSAGGAVQATSIARGPEQKFTLQVHDYSPRLHLAACTRNTTQDPDQLFVLPMAQPVVPSTANSPIAGHYGSVANFAGSALDMGLTVRRMEEKFSIREFQAWGAFETFSTPPLEGKDSWTSKLSNRLVRASVLAAFTDEVAALGGRSWLLVNAMATDLGDAVAQRGAIVVAQSHDLGGGALADIIAPDAAWAIRNAAKWGKFAVSNGFSGIHWETLGDLGGKLTTAGADIPGFLRAALPILLELGLQQTCSFVDGFGWDPMLTKDVGPGVVGRTLAFPYWDVRTSAGILKADDLMQQEGFVLSRAPGNSSEHVGEAQNQDAIGTEPLDLAIARWLGAASQGGAYHLLADGSCMLQGSLPTDCKVLGDAEVSRLQAEVGLPAGPPSMLSDWGENGDHIGFIEWAKLQRKCLGVQRGVASNPELRLWDCEKSRSLGVEFALTGTGGPLQPIDGSGRCVGVAESALSGNGDRLRLLDSGCDGPGAVFEALPSGLGQLRWTAYGQKCVEAKAAAAGAELNDELHHGDSIFLRTGAGKYMMVNTYSSTRIEAKYAERNAWERLSIERKSGAGVVHSGDVVFLRAHSGNVFYVHDGAVNAKWRNLGTWESLVVRRVAGSGPVRSGDAVAIESHQGEAVYVAGEQVSASSSDEAKQQTWTIDLDAELVVVGECSPQASDPSKMFATPVAKHTFPPTTSALLGHYGYLSVYHMSRSEIREAVRQMVSHFGAKEFQFYDAFQMYSHPPDDSLAEWKCIVANESIVRRSTIQAATDEIRHFGGRSWLYVQAVGSDVGDAAHQDGFVSVATFTLSSGTPIFDVMVPNAAWGLRIVPEWAAFAKALGFSGIHWDTLGTWDSPEHLGLPAHDADIPGFLRAALPTLRSHGLEQTMNFVNGYGYDHLLSRSIGLGWIGQVIAFPYWEVWSPSDESRFLDQFGSRGGSVMAEYPGIDAHHGLHDNQSQNVHLKGDEPFDIALSRWQMSANNGGTYVMVGDGLKHIRQPYFPDTTTMSEAAIGKALSALRLPPTLPKP